MREAHDHNLRESRTAIRGRRATMLLPETFAGLCGRPETGRERRVGLSRHPPGDRAQQLQPADVRRHGDAEVLPARNSPSRPLGPGRLRCEVAEEQASLFLARRDDDQLVAVLGEGHPSRPNAMNGGSMLTPDAVGADWPP
ncbi:hypothetical protein [Streptomyces lydicus]|uniref:hypothetical protein n=1 Tax=Streptomyces lydicus TaxID=47763 RepID=UPI0013E99917|nr:hypothetical protein [Streptomyces lydicus]MCZ1011918.1 hypothetical protein [Streptomyces lydicus]